MTVACRDLEVDLSLRAAGALDADDVARLEAHLAGCPGCRAEAARTEELLDLARLPPPSGQERRLLLDLPRLAVAELRAGEQRVVRAPRAARAGRRIAAGALVAAALVALALAPALIRRRAPSSPQPVEAEATATWQEPDLDRLWQDAGVLSLESTAASGAGADAVLAALDEGEGG